MSLLRYDLTNKVVLFRTYAGEHIIGTCLGEGLLNDWRDVFIVRLVPDPDTRQMQLAFLPISMFNKEPVNGKIGEYKVISWKPELRQVMGIYFEPEIDDQVLMAYKTRESNIVTPPSGIIVPH